MRNKLLLAVIALSASFFVNRTAAQDAGANHNRYQDVLKRYNKSLDKLGASLIAKDSARAYNILAGNEAIYLKLAALDTTVAKDYMTENTIFLDSFRMELNNPNVADSVKKKHIVAYGDYTRWFKIQQVNPGLEKCAECFLVRKIKVTVLKRVNDRLLDTIHCAQIDYKKQLPNSIGKIRHISSYPCADHEQLVSTGPVYLFTVQYNGKKYDFEKEVSIGASLTDILSIPIILSPATH